MSVETRELVIEIGGQEYCFTSTDDDEHLNRVKEALYRCFHQVTPKGSPVFQVDTAVKATVILADELVRIKDQNKELMEQRLKKLILDLDEVLDDKQT